MTKRIVEYYMKIFLYHNNVHKVKLQLCFIIPFCAAKSSVNTRYFKTLSHMAITWSKTELLYITLYWNLKLKYVILFAHFKKKGYLRGKLDVFS